MNVAVGGNWPGKPDDTTVFPQRMYVDYVRVYRYLGRLSRSRETARASERAKPRKPLPDGNQIYNGTFDDGDAHWTLQLQEGGEAAAAVEDGWMVVRRSDQGNQVYSIQLTQKPLHFKKRARYAVSFRARADAPCDIQVNAGKASQHWDSYSGKRTSAWVRNRRVHAFEFRMWAPTDTEARLEFNLGGAGLKTVYLDDVRVVFLEQGAALRLEEELLLEAEAYDAASGVDVEPCVEGGRNVGWWEPGDWAEFTVNVVTAGTYRAEFRYAATREAAPDSICSAARGGWCPAGSR